MIVIDRANRIGLQKQNNEYLLIHWTKRSLKWRPWREKLINDPRVSLEIGHTNLVEWEE